jgi:hypothetical protein
MKTVWIVLEDYFDRISIKRVCNTKDKALSHAKFMMPSYYETTEESKTKFIVSNPYDVNQADYIITEWEVK